MEPDPQDPDAIWNTPSSCSTVGALAAVLDADDDPGELNPEEGDCAVAGLDPEGWLEAVVEELPLELEVEAGAEEVVKSPWRT